MADAATLERRETLLRRAKLLEKARALETPVTASESDATNNPEQAPRADLLGSHGARLGASFGNPEGIKKYLESQNYTDVGYNQAGELVAKGLNGQWYRDASNFTRDEQKPLAENAPILDKAAHAIAGSLPAHPINWLENKVGGALPTIGGLAGAGAAIAEGPVTGGLSLATLAAQGGEGQMLGEILRRMAGGNMGFYQQAPAADELKSLGATGLEGATGGIATPLTALPFPIGKGLKASVNDLTSTAANRLWSQAGKSAAWLQSTLAGVPREAVEAIYKNPDAAIAAMKPGFMTNQALPAARQEFRASNRGMKQMINAARSRALDTAGELPISTQAPIASAQNFLAEHAPNPQGYSPVSESERAYAEQLMQKGLTTAPAPGAQPSQLVTMQVPGPDRVVRPEVSASEIQIGQPEWDPFGLHEGPKVTPTGRPIVVEPAVMGPGTQEVSRQAEIPFRDLLKTADSLTGKINSFDNPQLAGETSGPAQAWLRSARRDIKTSLHEAQPDYGVADASYSSYAPQAKLARRALKPGQGESFLDTLFGKNKGELQQAVERVAPNTYENQLKPLAAVRAFDESASANGWLTKRQALRYGLGGLGAASMTTDPKVAGTLASLSAVQSPQLQRSMAINGAKYLAPAMRKAYETAVLNNTQLLAPAAAQAINPWSLLHTNDEEAQ